MRKLLIFLLLFAAPVYAAPQITVQASAVTLLGSGQTISITVQLIDPNNTGVLKVTGTGLTPIMQASSATPGTTATVGPIYGNDVIKDAFGNVNTTYYLVTVYAVNNGVTLSTLQQKYQFTGSGTIDLSTATPFGGGPIIPASVIPVVQNPTAPQTTGSQPLTIPGNITGQGNNTWTGTNSFASINKVVYADQQAGATADVKLANCITALPSGGVCDARGFGATTQSLAAQVTVNSGVTILFDPNTIFQAASSALNPFLVKVNSAVKGLHFDCGNQPSYTGTVFTFNDNYRDGNNTAVEDIRITCSGVTGGVGAAFTSASAAQAVDWVTLRHWSQFGLQYQVTMAALGGGFVNDVHMYDMTMTRGGTSSAQIHMTTNTGSISGNQCMVCSFEAQSVNTNYAILMDGTATGGDLITANYYSGMVWDTTVPFKVNNLKAVNNVFAGNWGGTPSDGTLSNTYLGGGIDPILGQLGTIETTGPFYTVFTGGDAFTAKNTSSTFGVTSRWQNQGGSCVFGLDNSTGTNFGNGNYASNLQCSTNLYITSPVVFKNGTIAGGTAAGLTGTGACATITTQAGGSWAGTFKCTGTTGASTVTITPGTTAPNGFYCEAQDETTRANLLQQTAHGATTCTLTATSVTQNDVFVFSVIAF